MENSILVIAAHPDDEILGCGGSLYKYAKKGFKIHVAFMADGEKSRLEKKNENNKIILYRQNAAKKALKTLGLRSLSFHNFPDNAMDTVPLIEIVRVIEDLINIYKPSIVFTHAKGDVNIDHQKTHQAVLTASRPQNNQSIKKILCFEIPSSSEWQFELSRDTFVPNYYIDITETLEKKIDSLKFYKKELRKWPHPRSIKGVSHLAHWRGATIGRDAAEAFMLARNID